MVCSLTLIFTANMIVVCHCLLHTLPLLPLVHRLWHFSTGTSAESRVQSGRAASGGVLALEPPRSTRNQPECIRAVDENGFFNNILV